MNQYLIALGSNLGDRHAHILRACEQISEQCGTILQMARMFENPPMGQADQFFLNSTAIIESRLQPLELLNTLLAIEKSLGRERTIHWGNRTIDLDIILWIDEAGISRVMNCPELEIPHPRAHLRDFVLVPATEIAGNWLHPTEGQTLANILHRFRAQS